MAQQLLLVRHAALAAEHKGRYIGATDVPLGPSGLEQSRALAHLLALKKPLKCFCSPSVRARQTAQAISEYMSLPTQVDDDLQEVDFGQWEGKKFDEIAAGYPDEVKQWAEHFEDFTFPGGESVEAFMERVRRAADRVAHDPAETVLAVTHGGVIRHMICHFLGLEPWRYILFDVQYSTCATVRLFNGKGILTGLNERWLGEGG